MKEWMESLFTEETQTSDFFTSILLDSVFYIGYKKALTVRVNEVLISNNRPVREKKSNERRLYSYDKTIHAL